MNDKMSEKILPFKLFVLINHSCINTNVPGTGFAVENWNLQHLLFKIHHNLICTSLIFSRAKKLLMFWVNMSDGRFIWFSLTWVLSHTMFYSALKWGVAQTNVDVWDTDMLKWFHRLSSRWRQCASFTVLTLCTHDSVMCVVFLDRWPSSDTHRMASYTC